MLLEGLGSQFGQFGVFCGTAANESYRNMFIAAASGIGLTELYLLRVPPPSFDALGIFELALAMGLALGSIAIHAVVPTAFWFAAAAAIGVSRYVGASCQEQSPARGNVAVSSVLYALAAAFVAFPVSCNNGRARPSPTCAGIPIPQTPNLFGELSSWRSLSV